MKKDIKGYYRETGTVNGQRYDIRCKSKTELRKKVQERIKEIEHGGISKEISPNITVQEWGERWAKTYKSHLQNPQSIIGRLKNYIFPHIGFMTVKAVRPINCQEVLNAMSGMSTDSVRKVREAMFSMFSKAVKEHIIIENPSADLVLPKVKPSGSHRAITERERQIVLETAKTHPAGAWVLTMLYAGLRPEETIVLCGSDLHDNKIHITKAYDRKTREPKPPKSEAGKREIPIISPLAAILPKVEPFEYVFKNTLGRPLNEKSMYRMWKSFKAAMATTEAQLIASKKITSVKEQLPEIEPYDFRHTFCTDLERAGVPITVAAKLMGHSKIEITARIYTHTGADVVGQAMYQLERLHSPTVGPTNKPKKYRKIVKNRLKQACANVGFNAV